MKTYRHILILLALLLTGVSFTSCNDRDDLNTDQYGNDIVLNTFGPCPVLRGGTLRFLGSHLDQVTEIDLPGADPITSINVVKSGRDSEITIDVPKEKCEAGLVTLKTAKGGTIQTVTPVTYIENIEFDKFYVGQSGNLTASVGDVVTLEGDYLNLMHAVVFADDVQVGEDEFLTHTRYQIQVRVPKEAKTGRIALSDAAENPQTLNSDEALVINLPVGNVAATEAVKAGETITVSGTSLDQIATINLEGASVDTLDIVRASDGSSLTFTLPAAATDGDVTLVTYSGVKIPAGAITTVVPTGLEATPNPVKFGATLTITGKDIDLVTNVSLPGSGETAITSQSADQLTVVVDSTAQAGDITLGLANGKSVSVAFTLVMPTVSAIAPTSLMAGEQVALRGTDLDLVAAITFPTNQTVEASNFIRQLAQAIMVEVPAAAVGEGLVLTLKNGDEVKVDGLTIQASTNPTLDNKPSGNAGAEVTLEGKNYNNVETVTVGGVKVTQYVSRTATSMTFIIPENVEAGEQPVVMTTTDGQSYTVGTLEVVPTEIVLSNTANIVAQDNQDVIYSFPVQLQWSDAGRFRIQRTGAYTLADLGLVADKSVMKIFKTGTGQAQINDGNWSSWTTAADWNGDVDVLEVVITQDMIDWMTGAKTDGWSNTAIIIQGDGITVSKITLEP